MQAAAQDFLSLARAPGGGGLGSLPPPAQLYTFTNVEPTLFVYNDPATDIEALPAVAPNFGLKEDKSWADVIGEVRRLNEEEGEGGVVYKLVFVGRHGQGVHNVAEAKYGTQAWDTKWSFLNGDGELVWGPDPLLTKLGEQQADDVNEEWRLRLHNPNDTSPASGRIPLPAKLYSSPFTRALETAKRSYQGLGDQVPPQLIMEGLRETIGGHTCDMRSPTAIISQRFPPPEFELEPGFAPGDMLFSPITRESDPELQIRLRETLSRIFGPASSKDVASAGDAQVIGITCHSGVMQALFNLTGHRFFTPKTGAVVPLVLKAVPAQSK
ncbi:putative phosphoglycerate mutase pmu1 [Tilletia horrida]|nr:putative phosphoglycerate mutase pmu1 [Tilletia horrida]KAK0561911.1 putative phosphoglycerate mutase pmu1 [Tilletia horrida]